MPTLWRTPAPLRPPLNILAPGRAGPGDLDAALCGFVATLLFRIHHASPLPFASSLPPQRPETPGPNAGALDRRLRITPKSQAGARARNRHFLSTAGEAACLVGCEDRSRTAAPPGLHGTAGSLTPSGRAVPPAHHARGIIPMSSLIVSADSPSSSYGLPTAHTFISQCPLFSLYFFPSCHRVVTVKLPLQNLDRSAAKDRARCQKAPGTVLATLDRKRPPAAFYPDRISNNARSQCRGSPKSSFPFEAPHGPLSAFTPLKATATHKQGPPTDPLHACPT